jgi:arabinose-5-phosphate isomerase
LHPSGKLGRRLRRVSQLMHVGPQVPRVRLDTRLPDVIYEMSSKGLGMACVVDAEARLLGIITDGDLRRHMGQVSNLLDRTAADVMTRGPVTVAAEVLATEALLVMEQRRITSIVVADETGRVQGVLHLHDLWRTEMI